jgi:ATPase subunit of ABC transporter with duplicated ATPase domains
MPCLLKLESVALSTPDGRPLLSDLTLTFGRERTGLVGRNGSGKSTLLRVLAGLAVPSGGTVLRTGSVALLRQDWPDTAIPIAKALGVAAALAALRRLEAGDSSVEDAADADWGLEERVRTAFLQVGMPDFDLDRPLAALSGGERTRVALARALIEAPDLLLLDEPTNNLDRDGRQVVRRLIPAWPGGLVVASHDRALLEAMDRIVELTAIGSTVFGGGWQDFKDARDSARERAEAGLARAETALHQTERAIQEQRERQARRNRQGRADRAKGANSKLFFNAQQEGAEQTGARSAQLADRQAANAAADLAAARDQVEILTPLRIDLPPTHLPAARELLRFDAVDLRHGTRLVLGPLSFAIRGPERVALIGPNGAGKTSVLGLATGALVPTTGRVTRAEGALALLDQHVGVLDPAAGILDNLRRLNPDLSDNEARAALARFAFRNVQALRLVGALSGGETLRAGLACVLSARQPPQLLLLDEPTNHLDLDSIDVLEAALAGFDGALLVASHDSAFLDAIGIDRVIELPQRSGAEH